jgi:predicted NAD-dependent protein-ADP-ribosyltransferase YbiA (DUF1768 family)
MPGHDDIMGFFDWKKMIITQGEILALVGVAVIAIISLIVFSWAYGLGVLALGLFAFGSYKWMLPLRGNNIPEPEVSGNGNAVPAYGSGYRPSAANQPGLHHTACDTVKKHFLQLVEQQKGVVRPLQYVVFSEGDKEGYFSVFANDYNQSLTMTVQIKGQDKVVTFENPEHYFQSLRFEVGSNDWHAVCNATAMSVRTVVNRIVNKAQAHLSNTWYGRNKTEQCLWEENTEGSSVWAMRKVIQARMKADPAGFKRRLLLTDTAYILCDTPAVKKKGLIVDVCGAGADGMGQNLLGLLLMEARWLAISGDSDTEGVEAASRKQSWGNLSALRERAREERKAVQRGKDSLDGQPFSKIVSIIAIKRRDLKP